MQSKFGGQREKVSKLNTSATKSQKRANEQEQLDKLFMIVEEAFRAQILEDNT